MMQLPTLRLLSLWLLVYLSSAMACGDELCAGIPDASRPLEPALILPARIDRHIDGDTIGVEIRIKASIRLQDCWAAETRTHSDVEKQRGMAAAQHLAGLAPVGSPCTVYVPLRDGNGLSDLFSFGRLLGHVYVDDKDLSAEQVAGGFATAKKQPATNNDEDDR